MRIRTQKRPPAVVRRLLGPWFEFVSNEPDPWVIAVPDGKGGTVYAPVRNPDAFDMVSDDEAKR